MREKFAASRATPTDGAGGDVTAVEGGFALPTGVVLEADVAYGDDATQLLDVYRPAVATGAPMILFVHGGGWRRGDKALPQMVRNKVAHWVPRGFVFLSINHRMLPAANPLEQCEDLGRALAFTQRNAGRWGGDGSRVVVIGHSSGAHLAALLTVDGDLATRQGVRPWLATIALDTAALDVEAIMLRRHLPLYDVAFGADPGLWRAASPSHQLQTRPAAPMLFVSSSLRRDSVEQSQAFAARAVDAGGRVTLLPVPLSHRQINVQLGVPGEYTDAVDRFLQSVGIR
jgi:arylformamidase